jgi:SAM-dependent methyltransferase
MKKDLQSYVKHNEGYETDKDYYTVDSIITRTEEAEAFKKIGFEYCLSITKNLPRTHIDIGCGVGWLVRKMAPYFEKSIGIEPSHAAILAAKNLTEGMDNVSFFEEDMVEAYKKINLTEPAFFTTGAVFSHIENYYVIEFLKLLNEAPRGSVLFFSENYDKNIDWAMWHIRSQEWWVKYLPNWQLTFCNIENEGYSSGIYGICVGKENVLKNHKRGTLWKCYWKIDAFKNITTRVIKKLLRISGLSK